MNWVDGVLLALGVLICARYLRQEFGRGLLETVVVLGSAHVSRLYSELLTARLGWEGSPASGGSPHLQGLLFVGLLGLGLPFAWLLHQRSRWSLDQFDVPLGLVFGLVVAVCLAHVSLDLVVRSARQSAGATPGWVRQSVLADELHQFRTYHMVMDTLNDARYRGER